MPTATAQANTADQFINPAADLPSPIQVQPAAVSTQASISPEHSAWRQFQGEAAAFEHHPLDDGQSHRLVGALCNHQCISPRGFDCIVLDTLQGKVNCSLVIEGLDPGKELESQVVMDNTLCVQSFDEWQDNAPVDGRDHVHPVSREPRRIERCVDEEAFQVAFFCITA